MRPSASRHLQSSAWLSALALAIALGAKAGPSAPAPAPLAPPSLPASPSPAAAQGSKDSNPWIDLARKLGVPGWLLTTGGAVGAVFLLGEPIQKSLKAWRQGLGLKPEPPVAAAPPPPPAAGQVVSGTDHQTLQEASAGGNLTVASGGAQVDNTTIGRDRVEGDQYNAPTTIQNAQTIHNHNAPPDKRERVLSTIDPAPQGVGVMGREEQLADLEARMGEPGNDCRLVVHGESGVGKSELLREYARRHESRYPGGRYWIDCRLNLAQEIASIGRNCWQMDWLDGPLDEQACSVLQQLAKDKVLLLLDNASSQEQLKPFLPPAGQAHVLISSTSRDWAPPMVEVWRHEGLQRLDCATGVALLERVAGAEVARQVGAQVIKQLGGLPVHLLPTARTVARKARLGRLSEQDLVQLSAEGVESFSIPWQALGVAGRWLLQAAARWFNPNALVEAELVAALAGSFPGESVVQEAVDACRELYLLQGDERLALHQLLVRFVDAQPAERLGEIGAQDLGPAVAAALQKAAERVATSPTDGEALATLQCHQLSWEFWRQDPDGLTAEGCRHMGTAHLEVGQFVEAARWFAGSVERIRQEPELDHGSLGRSLHQLGFCATQQGKWQEAAGWYEQAVAEKRQGDLHGRVDHESLGRSLHQLGTCAYQQGKWQEAAGWLEQAEAEKRQGDIFGRVDSNSVALSEKGLALCRKMLGSP